MLSKATRRALHGATVTSSHVDWLTVTTRTPDRSDGLWGLGNRLCAASEEKGELPTAWHAHGYRGAHVNGIAYGARADGCYLRLSGLKSAENWFEALTTAENCSRIDLTVDTQFDLPVASLVDELYTEVPNSSRHGGRPPMRRVVKDTRGGQTLYFGARSSERFGRLYDKGVESKSHGAGQRWRWEVEAKERAAAAFGSDLLTAASPESYIQGAVAGFFYARAGVTIAQLERSLKCLESPEPPRAEQLLKWLASGVRPTVARLVEVYGLERVLHALGIPLKSAVAERQPVYEPLGGRPCPPSDRFTR